MTVLQLIATIAGGFLRRRRWYEWATTHPKEAALAVRGAALFAAHRLRVLGTRRDRGERIWRYNRRVDRLRSLCMGLEDFAAMLERGQCPSTSYRCAG